MTPDGTNPENKPGELTGEEFTGLRVEHRHARGGADGGFQIDNLSREQPQSRRIFAQMRHDGLLWRNELRSP